nr:hypothetical protein [uncultured Novosphingobium sp.]
MMDRIGKQDTAPRTGILPRNRTLDARGSLPDPLAASRGGHLPDKPVAPEGGSLHDWSKTDWRRKMSDNIAYALLVYTALQIFVTVGALKAHGESLLPYLALVILVVAIIPACRRFEARWNRLDDEQAHDPALGPYFRRDRILLWVLAIGLPFAITGLFKGLSLLTA